MEERNTIGYKVHDAFQSGLIRKVTKRLCPPENVLTVVTCVYAGDLGRALGTNPSQMLESYLWMGVLP